ncbi:UDP-N-acetyl-D-glucosamine dehydrogenase [Acidihalobacter prosperus]|uniref:UDP-N-acetyl-D-glucosamine dehydrogenase n=1 Tax=Acidihalobacter prosperus TaxID=160660 RepID=A0A1A6C905_9GAMM|nr:UDP-N-acetyl-D-glucosamine dehydrogenase [Acidihalobacter prosperus]
MRRREHCGARQRTPFSQTRIHGKPSILSETLKTAVIGVGYLGRFHAQKYAALPEAELVAVADPNRGQAERVAEECGTRAVTDYRELLGAVDAVSVVVPTQLHHAVARDCLSHGIHVMLEKPMTTTVAEADELIALARERNLVLQIGHLERFNAAVLALNGVLDTPRFIESHRLAAFNPRGADVNVVLDLMIHDIDIIQTLVRSPIDKIDANGVSVLTAEIDIANARLHFENGCVANVTASRVSMKPQRKMRVFQNDAYISIDFQDKILSVHRKGEREIFPGIPEITSQESLFESSDAIRDEIAAFLDAIRRDISPPVTGEDGRLALQTAIRISELLASAPS